MPEHMHLARARERFEAAIKKELSAQNNPVAQINRPHRAFSPFDHLPVNNPGAQNALTAQIAQIMQSHDLVDNNNRPLIPEMLSPAGLDYVTARIMADRNQTVPWTRNPQLMQAELARRNKAVSAAQTPTTQSSQPPAQQSSSSDPGKRLGRFLRLGADLLLKK